MRIPELFSSERHGIVLRNADAMALAAAGVESSDGAQQADDSYRSAAPSTTAQAHLAQLHAARIARLEDQIRRYAISCLDEVAQKREVDFVSEVAHRIPAAIALSLMGVPEQDWDRLAELEHIAVTGTDPEFTHGKPSQEAQADAGMEMFGYFAQLVMKLREQPGDDLISQLLAGEMDGEPLPWEQVVAEAGLLLAGGLDTTRAAASAGAVLPLIENPDQWRALQDDPSLLDTAVDEFVRWASPITSEARTVTADTELHGVSLREGDRVAMWSPSCNRDEDVFDEPFRFDVAARTTSISASPTASTTALASIWRA